MTCEECEKAHESGDVYPYRIGADGIGWGIISIVGCRIHASMAIDLLNDFPKAMQQVEDAIKERITRMEKQVDELQQRGKELDEKLDELNKL